MCFLVEDLYNPPRKKQHRKGGCSGFSSVFDGCFLGLQWILVVDLQDLNGDLRG